MLQKIMSAPAWHSLGFPHDLSSYHEEFTYFSIFFKLPILKIFEFFLIYHLWDKDKNFK